MNRNGSGYTSEPRHALRVDGQVEPEAVPADYQQHLSATAHRNAAQQREINRTEQAATNGWARRIQLAKAQARHAGIDVHRELTLIKHVMRANRSDRAIDARISALE